jgi:hypothetical protein
MLIIWGSGMYGKVDEVPQFCHVSTRFGHLWYIPMIPMGSYAVLEQSGGEFRGVAIPLSGKSILMAWLRTAIVLGTVATVVTAIASLGEDKVANAIALAVLSVFLIAVFIFTKKSKMFTQASYERAVQLGQHIGVTAEGWLMIEILYGRMNAEQADRALEQMEREAEIAADARPQISPSGGFGNFN